MAMGSLYCQLVADGANTFLFIVFPFLSFCSSLNHGFTLNFVAVGSSHHFLFRPPCRSKQLNLSTSWHYLFYSQHFAGKGGMALDITCFIANILQVGCKGVRLMVPHPLGWGAVVVVGVHVVVVHIQPCQDGTAGRAAHGRGDEGVDEVGTLLYHLLLQLGHCLQGPWSTGTRC